MRIALSTLLFNSFDFDKKSRKNNVRPLMYRRVKFRPSFTKKKMYFGSLKSIKPLKVKLHYYEL